MATEIEPRLLPACQYAGRHSTDPKIQQLQQAYGQLASQGGEPSACQFRAKPSGRHCHAQQAWEMEAWQKRRPFHGECLVCSDLFQQKRGRGTSSAAGASAASRNGPVNIESCSRAPQFARLLAVRKAGPLRSSPAQQLVVATARLWFVLGAVHPE